MQPEAQMRYSFSSSVIIRDEGGRYLLIVNKNALVARGEIILTPVGGKAGIDPREEALFAAHGATFASKIAPDVQAASITDLFWHKIDPPMTDLVFRGPAANAGVFREIFNRRYAKNSETARREMREELVDETGVLRNKDIRHFFWKGSERFCFFSHVGEERAPSARANGEETLRLMSFFEAQHSRVAHQRLERFARRRPLRQQIVARLKGRYAGPLVYFATAEEILSGRASDGLDCADGATIASIAKTMIKA